MREMTVARKEMARAIAKERVSKALRMNVLSKTLTDLAIGSQVLAYREQMERAIQSPSNQGQLRIPRSEL